MVRIRRFVALSSTTSTRRPARFAPSSLRMACSGPISARIVKWNVEPAPASLSTHIPPPIISHSRLRDRQAEPRAAVTARGRGVDLDERLEQTGPSCPAGCPMPVSRTANGTVVAARRPAAGSTRDDDLAAFGELDRVADAG